MLPCVYVTPAACFAAEFCTELFIFRSASRFCVQKLFFLSSAFHTLHFSVLQKTQRNAEHRSKMQNSAFSADKRIRPRGEGEDKRTKNAISPPTLSGATARYGLVAECVA